jgi:hypothetical protein
MHTQRHRKMTLFQVATLQCRTQLDRGHGSRHHTSVTA